MFQHLKGPHALLKMGSRSDNLCVNVATKYTSYICIHSAAVANLCSVLTLATCYN